MILWDKIKEKGKKVLIVLGAVFAALSSIFVVKSCNEGKIKDEDKTIEDTDAINRMAAIKREEAISRIQSVPAHKLAESYGTVSDAIDDGKQRFRDRCSKCTTDETDGK